MLQLLALSGSLRASSSNTALLDAARLLAPADINIEIYTGLGQLPHFNPDLERELPPTISDLRVRIGQADGLLISCPEYARGIPGSFKNLLDWLVGSSTFPNKPVALFNASPRASEAQAALRLVLETMSARIIEEASLSIDLLSRKMDATAIIADVDAATALTGALNRFGNSLRPRDTP